MDKKEDVRITRSKRDLRNAFFELVKTRSFDKITVTDICRIATINKMTFYKHYQDKYDLLDDCVRSVAENVYNACVPDDDIDGRIAHNPVEFFAELLSSVMEECHKRREVVISLVYGNNSPLRFVVESCCMKILKQLFERLTKIYEFKYPVPMIITFMTGGFINVIADELKSNDYSAEEFNAYSRTFFADLIGGGMILKQN